MSPDWDYIHRLSSNSVRPHGIKGARLRDPIFLQFTWSIRWAFICALMMPRVAILSDGCTPNHCRISRKILYCVVGLDYCGLLGPLWNFFRSDARHRSSLHQCKICSSIKVHSSRFRFRKDVEFRKVIVNVWTKYSAK